MDQDLTRAPLEPGIFQSVEIEQYEIHKRHLLSLRGMQVLEIPGDAPPLKQPARVSEMIADYAHALFDAEANRYPAAPLRGVWLTALAARIQTMMADRIWEVDTRSVPKLTYHATKDEIESMIAEALRCRVQELVGEASVDPVPQVREESNYGGRAPFQGKPEAPAVRAESSRWRVTARSAPPLQGSMACQIRLLRRESRLTIEELATQVGIAARTVQRHESGEVQEIRLRHIRDYERVFSSLLQRSVRLENVMATST